MFKGYARYLILIAVAAFPINAQTLLGTYTINAYSNAGGCPPTQVPTAPSDGNPFGCVGPAPGPIVVAATPGKYRVVTTSFTVNGGNPRVWAGTASSGVGYYLSTGIGSKVEFTVSAGSSVVLFTYDWYAYDNDPAATTTVQLFRLPTTCNPAVTLTEYVTVASSCGIGSPTGPLMANWGSFGQRPTLQSDAGDKLEIQCGSFAGTRQYAMWYTAADGSRYRVGTCPFGHGCNLISFYHSGDSDRNGNPDCIASTYWESEDGGFNDGGLNFGIPSFGSLNPWTGVSEPSDPYLDVAVTRFDVNAFSLTKWDYKYQYARSMPTSCNNYNRGAFVSYTQVDPPVGPLTEAFFDAAAQRLEALPADDAPMEFSSLLKSDLNGDGKIDMTDFQTFQVAFGSCAGKPNFNPRGDFDGDGCVTLKDYQVWLGLYNAKK